MTKMSVSMSQRRFGDIFLFAASLGALIMAATVPVEPNRIFLRLMDIIAPSCLCVLSINSADAFYQRCRIIGRHQYRRVGGDVNNGFYGDQATLWFIDKTKAGQRPAFK